MHKERSNSCVAVDSGKEHSNVCEEFTIPRIILGCWQLAGGHGAVRDEEVFPIYEDAISKGFTAFDCADIYTGVEERLGRFLRHLRCINSELLDRVKIHTKFVPDLSAIREGAVDRRYVRKICERSLRRLGVPRLDLVQFHWWDFSVPGMIDAALELVVLQDEGKIDQIGVTNFDVPNLSLLIQAGIPIITNQVQFSVLDSRPLNGMCEFAKQHGVRLLCYGTLAGGFLSGQYIGKSRPINPENRSLTKYLLMIDERGGWVAFQDLLARLQGIAVEAGLSIGAVAIEYVLSHRAVGAAIVGTRDPRHIESYEELLSSTGSAKRILQIRSILEELTPLSGDIYHLERVREGPHGSIMRYDLNRE